MKISKNARRDAKSLFTCCKVNGILDEAKVRQAVTSVIAQKPRGYVGVLSHFQRLVKLEVAKRTARVESAVAITPAIQANIERSLIQKYGPGLTTTYSQNAALIGGLKIQVGSDVYDGSIQARLNALDESF
ncbi:MAG: F0F1 ATP synthase subunit delta [Verrucomicrobiales bacterium]|nr:F0F1 ATP synthase subunit delta [Verrucomicrobiales bacterium]